MVGTYISEPWDKAAPSSDLTIDKLLFKSMLLTPQVTFHHTNIKSFCLNTPMDQPEYMRLKFNLMPTEIMQKHNLHELENDGWVYVCINLGMYGLPQAGILANKLLAKSLRQEGYYQC